MRGTLHIEHIGVSYTYVRAGVVNAKSEKYHLFHPVSVVISRPLIPWLGSQICFDIYPLFQREVDSYLKLPIPSLSKPVMIYAR